jgi:hypothetical protein
MAQAVSNNNDKRSSRLSAETAAEQKNGTRKKRRKKRSQAPVALVYFITLLIFLGVFGMFAKVIVEKLTDSDDEIVDFSDTYIDSYNTLYARVNNKNVLSDMTLIRICPEQSKILVIPMSPFTVSSTDGESTMREVYEDGGIRKLSEAVDETFGISTDYYATVSNQAFEDVADIIGGFLYQPDEELYYISSTDDNDVSIRKDEQVMLTGRQIRLICQYPIFQSGRQGNTEFLGLAMTSLLNNAFDQIEITTNSLDILYNKISSSSTNLTENDYKEQRVYIKDMLQKQVQPAYSMIPEGQWTDSSHFTVSDDFKQKVYDEMEATKSQEKSGEVSQAE